MDNRTEEQKARDRKEYIDQAGMPASVSAVMALGGLGVGVAIFYWLMS